MQLRQGKGGGGARVDAAYHGHELGRLGLELVGQISVECDEIIELDLEEVGVQVVVAPKLVTARAGGSRQEPGISTSTMIGGEGVRGLARRCGTRVRREGYSNKIVCFPPFQRCGMWAGGGEGGRTGRCRRCCRGSSG